MNKLRFGEFGGDAGGDLGGDTGSDFGSDIGDSTDFGDISDSSFDFAESEIDVSGIADTDLSVDVDSDMKQSDYISLADGDVVDLHPDESSVELSDLDQLADTAPSGGELADLQDIDNTARVYDFTDAAYEKEMTVEPNIVGEFAPSIPVTDAAEWETLKDVPFAGDSAMEEEPKDLPFEDTLTSDTDVSELDAVDEWISDINPNFDPFDTESEYSNNCGSCAYAVHQRLEGDKEITASADNIGTIEQMNAQTGMEQVSMAPEMIEQTLLEQGNGAHAIIGIDRAEGPGHWFNAANIDGKVVTIDGQTGEITDWPPDYGDVVNWDMSMKKGA